MKNAVESSYRRYGLNRETDPRTNQPEGKVFTLKETFLSDTPKSTATQGIFLGITALQNLVQEITEGNFDGLRVCFGQRPTGELALVAQPIAFDTSGERGSWSDDLAAEGTFYTSIGGVEPEPPVAECPPLTICGKTTGG